MKRRSFEGKFVQTETIAEYLARGGKITRCKSSREIVLEELSRLKEKKVSK